MKRKTIALVAHSNVEWISKADLISYSFLIGVDRAAYVLLKLGISVDLAIGDFDSVTKKEMNEIRTRISTIKQYPQEKDQTDLELAVTYALTIHPEEIALFGVTGGRLDQSLAALHLLRTIHEHKCRASVRDEHNFMALVSGKYQIPKTKDFPYLSILPATDEIIVTIKGCKYPLEKYRMEKGTTLGVSNVIISDFADISVHKGTAYCVLSRDRE
ncbi:MAG: Thiamine pyrophosphokinase [Microgenomates group bacterium GW2011_GWC1_43_11]|uniref:Thiamine diphosphokinase n=1 Tax=Candidatus Gottesmanbacteria bacterium GW2011_GWB1_44_11c TaxID=1618447 RepID=A0A0G1JTU7_9BACT|nr:MAG: Thiamine pyrophosphokinase [Microgenomates group bacterium GW2011_GWC1_43_11]KKT38899.1 MAG: Thiamine pyrophosphokinase [Candidatus Gottesmanbacteria bacterium GW2011_GWB1_44_11c]HCM82480.1 thiamine diphosphokinase [Patescibacteria group bacterium]